MRIRFTRFLLPLPLAAAVVACGQADDSGQTEAAGGSTSTTMLGGSTGRTGGAGGTFPGGSGGRPGSMGGTAGAGGGGAAGAGGVGGGSGGTTGGTAGIGGTAGSGASSGTGGASGSGGTAGGSGGSGGTGGAPWEALLTNAHGYGAQATGGAGGPLCHVTNKQPSGSGSLVDCLSRPSPQWIVFDVDGEIPLNGMKQVKSSVTLDGRGADVTLTAGGLLLKSVSNVVIHNLKFANTATTGIDDCIRVTTQSHDIWVDHVSAWDSNDGLLDITKQSTDITVSWSHFFGQTAPGQTVMLVGLPQDTADSVIRLTLHHNYFDGSRQRHPLIRHGRAHIYNNYYRGWLNQGIDVDIDSQVLAEFNVFEAASNPFGMRIRPSASNGSAKSVSNLHLNGAITEENNPTTVFTPPYATTPDATAGLAATVSQGAGWQSVSFPQ